MDEQKNIPDHESDAEFARLATLYLENNLTDADSVRLRAILFASTSRRAEFADITIMRCAVRNAIRRGPKQKQPVEPNTMKNNAVPMPRRRSGLAAMVIAPLLAAAAIALVAWIYHSTQIHPSVGGSQSVLAGKIIRTIHAIWAKAPAESKIFIGRSYRLTGGYAQIALQTGPRIVLNGPVTFRITSPRDFFLSRGKITAKAVGGHFTVKTPTSIVRDQGTWFAVGQGKSGKSLVGVYEGRVTIQRSSAGGPARRAILLRTGQASVITAKAVLRLKHSDWRQHFARRLWASPESLSVVDLFCGGDGTTHRSGFGLNVSTAACGRLPQIARYHPDYVYHSISGIPVLDGCFVPGNRRAVRIDSAGDVFTFPAGANAGFFLLWAGHKFPTPPDPRDKSMSPVLGGVNYSAPGHTLIYFHPNKGITLNLKAIRKMYPADKLTTFSAMLGNSFVSTPASPKAPSAANFWVIVDGKPRYTRLRLTPADGGIQLRIPLHKTDHFLTIADTAADRGISRDWIILGDPRVKLVPSLK